MVSVPENEVHFEKAWESPPLWTVQKKNKNKKPQFSKSFISSVLSGNAFNINLFPILWQVKRGFCWDFQLNLLTLNSRNVNSLAYIYFSALITFIINCLHFWRDWKNHIHEYWASILLYRILTFILHGSLAKIQGTIRHTFSPAEVKAVIIRLSLLLEIPKAPFYSNANHIQTRLIGSLYVGYAQSFQTC